MGHFLPCYLCMLLEISSFALMYASWDTEHNRHKFLLFWAIFCPFTLLLITQKTKIWKIYKKPPGNIILLHMCTINEVHMMHGSWDIKRDRVFCHFGPFFALWLSQQPQKSKFWKNEKKPGDITLQLCIANDNHAQYG